MAMIGVIGLGAYAIYRMIANGSHGGSGAAGGGGPVLSPGSFTPPADSTAVLGDSIAFEKNRWYGGVVDLGGAGAIAPVTANAAGLANALASYGFGTPSVPNFKPPNVFLSAAEAALHVPPYAITPTSKTARYFVGLWTLPSQSRPRPAWLPLLWSTIAPKP